MGGPAPKPKPRVFTWIIVGVNVLFLIWIITAVGSTSGDSGNCGGLDQQTCNDAEDVGTAIGVFVIVAFWAFVDVILGIIWIVTRKREPEIRYVQQPGPGWYPDPPDPSMVRYFDGQQWTGHTQPRQY